jgi:capsular polysaccharide biosynthesis protein
MSDYQDEINLMDYVMVLWKRKWMIIIPTVLLAVAAGVFSFMMTPVWEVDAVIQPSKLYIQTEQGAFSEFIVVDPKQIVGQINQKSYDILISTALGIDIRRMPRIQAENLRDTKLIRVWIRDNDIGRGKKIILALFDILKDEFNKKIEAEVKVIDIEVAKFQNSITEKGLNIKDKVTEAKILGFQKDRTLAEIQADQRKVQISEDRYKSITEEMGSVKKRIDDLEEQLRKTLGENRQGGEGLGLLLYLSQVQENLRYYNTLDEKLSTEKITQENLRLSIKENNERIKELDALIDRSRNEIEKINTEIENIKQEINLLNERKLRIDYARLVKDATSSLGPVSPRKARNVLITGMLAAMMFAVLAFFLEYLNKQKALPPQKAS